MAILIFIRFHPVHLLVVCFVLLIYSFQDCTLFHLYSTYYIVHCQALPSIFCIGGAKLFMIDLGPLKRIFTTIIFYDNAD